MTKTASIQYNFTLKTGLFYDKISKNVVINVIGGKKAGLRHVIWVELEYDRLQERISRVKGFMRCRIWN